MKIRSNNRYNLPNLVRTKLLVYSYNENIEFIKKSHTCINSETPKQIMRKNSNFEVKMNNPIIRGLSTSTPANQKIKQINKNSGQSTKKATKSRKDVIISSKEKKLIIKEGFEKLQFICHNLKNEKKNEKMNSLNMIIYQLKFLNNKIEPSNFSQKQKEYKNDIFLSRRESRRQTSDVSEKSEFEIENSLNESLNEKNQLYLNNKYNDVNESIIKLISLDI